MPTTVLLSMFAPTAFVPVRKRFANAWLTMTTRVDEAESCRPKSRPARSGVPYVANQPGVTKLARTLTDWLSLRALLMPTLPPSPCSGVQTEAAAASTPGTARAASASC
jgi:hypothetical protein